ncbi:MAG: glycosyltransferase family 2 protein [Actinomycetota bacterium]
MDTTVIVPARNEEASIERCLTSVLAQDVPDLEVIVIDGASTDGTLTVVEAIAGSDHRVRVLHNPHGTIPASLNMGLMAAHGRWLVRVDAHSTVPPGYVRTLTGHLATGRWGGVGGRKDAEASTPMGEAIALALGSPAGVGDSAYHWAQEPRRTDHVPFGAYPVALLRTLGGWDERLDANEDYEMDLRIRRDGHELLLDPAVRIRWRSKDSLGALWRQYLRYGRGKADVARLHPGTLAPRHLAAPAMVAGVSVAMLIAPFAPAAAALLAAPYPVFVLGAGVWIGVRAGRASSAPKIAAALATMHVAWGLGYWHGRLRPPRSRAGGVAAVQSPAGPVR